MEPQVRVWVPEGPGALFGSKKGPEKHITLWRDRSPTRFPRIFHEGNVLYGTQEPFGCTDFPPNPPKGGFYRGFSQIRKPLGPPGPLWGLPIALCGACLLTQGPIVGLPNKVSVCEAVLIHPVRRCTPHHSRIQHLEHRLKDPAPGTDPPHKVAHPATQIWQCLICFL